MSEYIEREAVLRRIEEMRVKENDYAPDVAQAIYDFVVDVDAADVAPVKHGRWLECDGDVFCSECESQLADRGVNDMAISRRENRFCYYCGAKMDGGDDDATD